MMKALLYVDLTAAASYQKALPEQVQRLLPEVTTFDMDATSSELVLHYALRLLRESGQVVVYIHVAAPETSIDALLPLLEEIFRERPDKLIMVSDNHPRLLRMLQARSYLLFKQAEEAAALQEIKQFLG